MVHENLPPSSWLYTASATLAVIFHEVADFPIIQGDLKNKKSIGPRDAEFSVSWTDLQSYIKTNVDFALLKN